MTKIADLKHHEKNPKTITDAKKAMLKKSLDEFGDLSGIVYNVKLDRMVGGHQRTKVLPSDADIIITQKYDPPTRTGTTAEGHVVIAGEKYKYREVSWDQEKHQAAMIAANKHGGEWDFPSLNELILELDHANYDMELLGYDEDEIEKQLTYTVSEHERTVSDVDEDEVPDHVDTRTKIGDTYVLGRHRLRCGDSTSISDVDVLMNGEKADMVFTDPPYGMSVVKKDGNNNGLGEAIDGVVGVAARGKYKPVIGNDSTQTAIDAYNLCRGLNIPSQIFWGAQFYAEALEPSSGWIVWDKENGEGFFADGELAWSNSEKQLRLFRHQWKGMIRDSERGQKRVHPTQKPIALAEWCFENYGEPKSVLDLFGGSGSTLIACEKTNRRCFMMELDPHYCDVIVARYCKYAGTNRVVLNGKETEWVSP